MACTLDILSKMKNQDYKAFFESNVSMWSEIDTKEQEYLSL